METFRPNLDMLCEEHAVNRDKLVQIATRAGLPDDLVDRMLKNVPVPFGEASLFLEKFSLHVRKSYEISQVDIPTTTEVK